MRGQHPETDPVRALREWVKAADLRAGDALFQRIGRRAARVIDRPLSPQSIGEVVTERAHAAGLDDLNITGHSLRAGHATQASNAGVPALRIGRTTRHAASRRWPGTWDRLRCWLTAPAVSSGYGAH